MNILYVRVSSFFQNSERQKINKKDYDLVIEDVISGSVPFFERPGGKQVLKYLNDGVIKCLYVHQIDRLGRNLRDVLNTAHTFTVKATPICFIAQGLRTIDEDGKENPISKLIISILGTVGEMERNQIRERQLEGIAIAKVQGKFTGRKPGSKEDTLKFLSKPQNQKALTLLKKGYKASEAAKISGIHINTVTKIKKVGIIG